MRLSPYVVARTCMSRQFCGHASAWSLVFFAVPVRHLTQLPCTLAGDAGAGLYPSACTIAAAWLSRHVLPISGCNLLVMLLSACK